MPTERISVNSNFGLLDDGNSRWGSLATSMVTNVTILILLLIIGAIHHQVVVKKMQADALLFPVEPPKPPKVEVPKVKVSGLAFASATSSRTLFAGTEG